VGQERALVDWDLYQFFIASALLTMLATPGLVRAADWLGARSSTRHPDHAAAEKRSGPAPTVVIVGFGVNGRNLARVLKAAHIGYRVVELNGDTVRRALRDGEPMLFGDATRREILEQAGVPEADMVVFAVSDIAAVRRAIVLARRLNPRLHIIVRSRMVTEIDELVTLGADEVVAEEFETSIEIFTACSSTCGCRATSSAETKLLRGDVRDVPLAGRRARGERAAPGGPGPGDGGDLPRRERDGLRGKTIREEDRATAPGDIIAVVRGGEPHTNPSPDLRLEARDSLVLVGSHAELDRAFDLLERGE
jgi:CPA2 family monovalent cation:H+ antiporter-2